MTIHRILIGLVLSAMVIAMWLTTKPGLDTPSTSPDPLTYETN